MCDRAISEDLFIIVSSPDRYQTQRMCDEVIDDCLAALKLIPNWFVTSKILMKLDNA